MDGDTPEIEPIPMELSDEDRAFLVCCVELQLAAAVQDGIEFSTSINPMIETRYYGAASS